MDERDIAPRDIAIGDFLTASPNSLVAEIERLRLDLTRAREELAASNEQLGRNRIGTHGPDC